MILASPDPNASERIGDKRRTRGRHPGNGLDGNDQTRPMDSRGVDENWFFLMYWRPRLPVLRITAASSRLRHSYETSMPQNVSV